MLAFLLACAAALAIFCFYLGWHPSMADDASRYRAKGGFYLSLGFIALVLMFFALQRGADDRLQSSGITPHPGIVAPMGLVAGQHTDDPVWVYETAMAGEEMLDFYRNPANVPGWELVKDEPRLLEFVGAESRLVISGNSRRVLMFSISPRVRIAPARH